MKIILDEKESLSIFYDALCNAYAIEQDSGLTIEYNDSEFTKARDSLFDKEGYDTSYESILMEMLELGYSVGLQDRNQREDPFLITKSDVVERVSNTPVKALMNILSSYSDGTDAEEVVQTVFFNKVIYG